MTYTIDNLSQEALNAFQRFDVDTKLALLWYGYLDLKDDLDPAISGPSTPTTTSSHSSAGLTLVDDLIQVSQEQQLQILRDIVSGKNTSISQTYSSLVTTAKLEFWLLLSRAMESGTIVQVPGDYQLPTETDDFVKQIKQLDFEQRVKFMKSVVVTMGANPQS